MLHHKLGPSSSSIWLNCPGSVAAQRDFPNTSNAAADEGTAAHELAEKTLKSEEKNCHDFIGELMYVGFDDTEYFVDEDMACLLYTSPSPRDATLSRMPSSA